MLRWKKLWKGAWKLDRVLMSFKLVGMRRNRRTTVTDSIEVQNQWPCQFSVDLTYAPFPSDFTK